MGKIFFFFSVLAQNYFVFFVFSTGPRSRNGFCGDGYIRRSSIWLVRRGLKILDFVFLSLLTSAAILFCLRYQKLYVCVKILAATRASNNQFVGKFLGDLFFLFVDIFEKKMMEY